MKGIPSTEYNSEWEVERLTSMNISTQEDVPIVGLKCWMPKWRHPCFHRGTSLPILVAGMVLGNCQRWFGNIQILRCPISCDQAKLIPDQIIVHYCRLMQQDVMWQLLNLMVTLARVDMSAFRLENTYLSIMIPQQVGIKLWQYKLRMNFCVDDHFARLTMVWIKWAYSWHPHGAVSKCDDDTDETFLTCFVMVFVHQGKLSECRKSNLKWSSVLWLIGKTDLWRDVEHVVTGVIPHHKNLHDCSHPDIQ